jgi:DNA-binding MarR family transcriptional regulator
MASKTYTQQQVLRMVKELQGARNIAAMAREFGVTDAYMGRLLRGMERPGPKILGKLGLVAEKVFIYRKVA